MYQAARHMCILLHVPSAFVLMHWSPACNFIFRKLQILIFFQSLRFLEYIKSTSYCRHQEFLYVCIRTVRDSNLARFTTEFLLRFLVVFHSRSQEYMTFSSVSFALSKLYFYILNFYCYRTFADFSIKIRGHAIA